jgi:hypothetical protein
VLVKKESRRNERKETVIVKKIKNIPTSITHGIKGIKKERTELIKETKDKLLNIKRATENAGVKCIICGNEIKKNQPFRALPKDKNCQEVRFYHLRACAPGSNNWKAFKANGKKAPENTLGQLSFKWKEGKR